MKKFICAACDLEIGPVKEQESSCEDLNEKAGESKGGDDGNNQKFIPTPDVWVTLCKYLLDGRSNRVRMFRATHYNDLTFCALCMRLMTKIDAFENEITQLYERIDAMVTCLKTKIKVSLDTSSTTEKMFVRQFMLGIQPTTKPKFESIPKTSGSEGDETATTVKGKRSGGKRSSGGQSDVESPESKKFKSRDALLNESESTDYNVDSEAEFRGCSEDDWGSGTDMGFNCEYGSDRGEGMNDNSMEEFKSPGKSRNSDGSGSGDKKKRVKKDTRIRKTERRRLDIKQLEEPDLFEWKGYKFRKLENGKIKCEHCPSSILNSQPNLILHIRKVHLREGVGVFPCPVCGKIYDRAEILKAHMFIHDEKRFQCYLCGKCYHQRGNLTHHIKTHTGNLKYECDFENCGKKFLTRNQLTRHTSRHLGVKSFQCEYCSRLFVEQSELNRHVRSHAEENPFKCTLCNSSFFIKYRLRRHYTNVHKVQPPEIIEMVETKMPPKPNLEVTVTNPCEAPTETGFVEEIVVTEAPAESNPMNLHKELITFQSMLE